MNKKTTEPVHWSFWVIGIVALVWNVLGVMNFFQQMDSEAVAALPEWLRTIIESRPGWATGAFAVAVFSGVLGCILLLLRKSAAIYVFVLSLFAVIVQMLPFLPNAFDLRPLESFMTILPLMIALFLIWYARRGAGHGWLN